jgi:AcrR family transcriptional regulator
VPKRVDHEERRRQIADALLRAAAARGLHATGMREVAAEAGVSLRLVQYYFGTKEELLLFATQQLAAQYAARVMARINGLKEADGQARPRDVIAAILTEAVPADDERRTFTIIYTAYLALSLTDPALAITPLVRNSNAVIDVIAAQLRAAQAAGDMPAFLDPDLEAVILMTMSAGLGTSVIGGHSSPAQAQAVIDYHLRRLFPASLPALCQASGGAGWRARNSCTIAVNEQHRRRQCREPAGQRGVWVEAGVEPVGGGLGELSGLGGRLRPRRGVPLPVQQRRR